MKQLLFILFICISLLLMNDVIFMILGLLLLLYMFIKTNK